MYRSLDFNAEGTDEWILGPGFDKVQRPKIPGPFFLPQFSPVPREKLDFCYTVEARQAPRSGLCDPFFRI